MSLKEEKKGKKKKGGGVSMPGQEIVLKLAFQIEEE